MIEKPIITGFTIESTVLDQPPVLLLPGVPSDKRCMLVDRIVIELERFAPNNRWGARAVWLFGQVPGEPFSDSIVWRDLAHPHRAPESVENSPTLPDWVADFVHERLRSTTQ